jgi:predicted DNA-binding transcriptional regulator YafY
MGTRPLDREKLISIDYCNYRGERSVREVIPARIWFGSTAWHPEPQWLLEAYDVEKDASRSFAIRDIRGFCEDEHRVPLRPPVEVAAR